MFNTQTGDGLPLNTNIQYLLLTSFGICIIKSKLRILIIRETKKDEAFPVVEESVPNPSTMSHNSISRSSTGSDVHSCT